MFFAQLHSFKSIYLSYSIKRLCEIGNKKQSFLPRFIFFRQNKCRFFMRNICFAHKCAMSSKAPERIQKNSQQISLTASDLSSMLSTYKVSHFDMFLKCFRKLQSALCRHMINFLIFFSSAPGFRYKIRSLIFSYA